MQFFTKSCPDFVMRILKKKHLFVFQVREPIADISYDDLIPKEDTQGLDPVDSIDVKRPKLRPNVADLFNSEDDNDNSKK